jgi:hypothetical protein
MTTEQAGNEIIRWHVECALADDCTTVEEITTWCFDRSPLLQPFHTSQGRAAFQEEVVKHLAQIQQDPSPCALTCAVETIAPFVPGISIGETLELFFGEPVENGQYLGNRH